MSLMSWMQENDDTDQVSGVDESDNIRKCTWSLHSEEDDLDFQQEVLLVG